MRPFLFILLACLISLPARGEDHSAQAEKAAQKIINACWTLSEEDRDSGVTARMREGTLNTALCMKKHILALSKQVLFKDDPLIQKDVAEDLDKIHHGVGGLYWNLHNSHDSCSQNPCGTMYHVLHNGALAHTMEDILRDFYQKIYSDDYYSDRQKSIKIN